MLGIRPTLDNILSFDQHVINIAKNCNYIQVLRHLLASVTKEVAKMMAFSIIGSRIDYCNSLFYGTTDRNLKSQSSTVARNCYKGDVASQWEIARFGHLGL